MYTLKSEIFPSFFIILLGSIDCYNHRYRCTVFWSCRINPFMTGIVNTNILAFLAAENFSDFSDWLHLSFWLKEH